MNKSPQYDLASEMTKNLREAQDNFKSNKIELALACLNKAAELLDNMNAVGASEVVTRVMERVASGRR
jgi:hypothetical protein